MESKKIKGTEHFVFKDRQEFEEFFRDRDGVIPPLNPNWRISKQGEWVIADDGGVVQILLSKELPSPTSGKKNYRYPRRYVRTVVGTFPNMDSFTMDTDFSKHPNRYRFNSATDAEYLERRKNRDFLSSKEVIFVTQICAGRTIQQAYEEAFGPTHDWYQRALFLLRRERILKRVKENVKDKLNEKFGGDVIDFIFENLVELVQIAKDKQNPAALLSALKEIGEWSGEKEKDKTVVKGQAAVMFQPFDNKELAKIEAEEVKVLSEADND